MNYLRSCFERNCKNRESELIACIVLYDTFSPYALNYVYKELTHLNQDFVIATILQKF